MQREPWIKSREVLAVFPGGFVQFVQVIDLTHPDCPCVCFDRVTGERNVDAVEFSQTVVMPVDQFMELFATRH